VKIIGNPSNETCNSRPTTLPPLCIKITKLMNYEDEFERRVQDARRREMALVQKEQFVWGLTLVIRVFTPVLASFATFVTYVLVCEENIMNASTVFTLTMLFNMLKFPINQGELFSLHNALLL